MELTFALTNGTCAGVTLPAGTSDPGRVTVGRPCATSDKDVPVIFHVQNREALERVVARFGAV
jgi:hypothetical protein